MPRQPLTIAEKQQRQLLRKLARSAGKQIARQSEVVQERAQTEARQMQQLIETERYRDERGLNINVNNKTRNLAEAIRSVTSVVRASFGLDQPVVYRYHTDDINGRILTAKTNLKEILLDINVSRLYDDSEAGIKKSIALLKGATYHEVAHCLWTKDWKTYKFPEGFDLWEYFSAWNLLEDGRIETLLIEKSPIIRNYLLPLLYEVVLAKHDGRWSNVVEGAPFLIVRSYLPKGIQRTVLRACAEQYRDMTILADMHRVSTAYQQADGWDDQIPLVVEFHELMKKWNSGFDRNDGSSGVPDPHGDHTYTENDGSDNTSEPVYQPVSKPRDSDWDRDEIISTPTPPTPDQPKDDKSDDDTQGEQGDKADSEEQQSENDQPGAPGNNGDTQTERDRSTDSQTQSQPSKNTPVSERAGTGEGETSADKTPIRDEIEQAFGDAINESVTTNELNEVVNQYHKALQRGLQKVIENTDRIVNPAMIATANNITLGMINALDTIVVTPDPSWKYHMDDGAILDLESFVNRDLGDDSYWVDKDGTGERGHDLSVSLLLDCSASMGCWFTELGIAGYAIRKACDHFDIPCTTVLFGSDSELLWDADDEPELIQMPNLGGTSIGRALLDVPNHRHGKGRHLVVIFTDGEWGDVESVRPFFMNGETCLLVGFGLGLNTLRQRSADVAVSIGQLLDLPTEVEKGIARFFV